MGENGKTIKNPSMINIIHDGIMFGLVAVIFVIGIESLLQFHLNRDLFALAAIIGTAIGGALSAHSKDHRHD